jgi:hypothetical protein
MKSRRKLPKLGARPVPFRLLSAPESGKSANATPGDLRRKMNMPARSIPRTDAAVHEGRPCRGMPQRPTP